jgi:hypothetical protein
MTDYELGAYRFLRIRFHLFLDALYAVAILVSPAVFGITPGNRWPLYAIGVISLILIATTRIRAEGTAAS